MSPADRNNHLWYVLRVKPRHEPATAAILRQRGFEEFLPTHRILGPRPGGRRQHDEPFFPGYVFCRFHPQSLPSVLIAPAVLSVVGIGSTPAPVEEAEISALRAVTNSGCRTHAWPFLRTGQVVRIGAGPLAGLAGLLVRLENSVRLVVSVT